MSASKSKSFDGNKSTELKANSNDASNIGEDEPSIQVDPVLQKKVNALKNIQLEIVKVEAKFYEELHQLECKFSKLYEPFFEKRKKIVVGEHEPTEQEGKWALDEEDEEAKVKFKILNIQKYQNFL